jgi:hypothetical protein
MRKKWLMVLGGLLVLPLAAGAYAAGDEVGSVVSGIGPVTVATGSVTFQVDMSVRICEGLMMVGDEVSVPGSFGDPAWTPGTDVLEDLDGDSIYTGTFEVAEGEIQYKFHDGNDWENDPNRTYTVMPGSQTIALVYFNNDGECNPPGGDVPVTFQVNMGVKLAEGAFDPLYLGEWVSVRGSFNSWGTADTLSDLDNDSIYTKTVMIGEDTDIAYKFVIREDDGSDTWEDGSDRAYHVPVGGGMVPVAWFNYDSVVSIPVNQNILLKTDLEAYALMGWFNPGIGDSVQVRGAFNNWAGTICDDPLSILEYEYLVQNYAGFSGDAFNYKFYLDFDEATAPTRFPGWTPGVGAEGWGYEHPAVRGDGNRVFVLPPINGNVAPDVYDYSDIDMGGILYSPDEVEVTLTADMGPAIASDGFNPETDTVRIVWEDALWRSIQILEQGAFPQVWDMTRQGTSNMYEVTFTVAGTTHYNMQYRLRFTGPLGEITEGGGLGVQNPFRSRFIQPLAPNSFPTTYSAPVDVWDTDGAPLPGEYPPYGPTNSVDQDPDLGIANTFSLAQNYPNPFNPATTIRYAIPSRTHVTLNVYNVLGQVVATLVNEIQEQGNYIARFEPKQLASGIYFYKLEAGDFTTSKKMILMK